MIFNVTELLRVKLHVLEDKKLKLYGCTVKTGKVEKTQKLVDSHYYSSQIQESAYLDHVI